MVEYFEEGAARIAKEDDTFFNPAQKLNRDVSAEVIRSYFEGRGNIRILTAMEATGLRGIRYLKEIDNTQLFLNDICPKAVATIKRNLELNGFARHRTVGADEDIRAQDERVNVLLGDCSVLMNRCRGFFDVIDIDPFGSCAGFVDDAFRAVKHNGLICFTCTDKAALCSNERKCYMRYGTHIKRIYSKNETPVRTLLGYISRVFSKYDASIVPVLGLSVDFYVRVIVRVVKNNGRAVLADNSHVLICGCLNKRVQAFGARLDPACDVCGAAMRLYGPFWNKSNYDKATIRKIIAAAPEDGNERMLGILRLMAQEIDEMFYYELPQLCSRIKVNSCKLRELMNGLANAGFAVSLVHYDSNSIKTDAPLAVVNEAMRERISGVQGRYSFENNQDVDRIFEASYFRGQVMSGLRPLSLPRK